MLNFQLTLAQEALQLMRREEEVAKKELSEIQTSLSNAKALLESKIKYVNFFKRKCAKSSTLDN